MKFGRRFRSIFIKSGKILLRGIGNFQARHSLVDTSPFLQSGQFAWVTELESQWESIKIELDKILEKPEEIPAFHQLSPDQKRISQGDNWKTFPFYVFGIRLEENALLCPQTIKAIEKLPGLQNAWFSILSPGYHIPPHRGPTRAVIRCHLGLVVPKDEDHCWLRVSDQIRSWQPGKCILFDDTYEHEVHNQTHESRVVLFLDVDRPSDWIGRLFNRLIILLVRSSSYVRDPIKNLRDWNQRLKSKKVSN